MSGGHDPFIAITDDERADMLRALGIDTPGALFASIPADVRYPALDMPPQLTEMELIGHMQSLARTNRTLNEGICVLGAGLYRHYVPPLPAMLVLQPPFLAGYQLSQAEMHQGILQLMFEFQEMICALTGMEVANSGLYDGASALAEAVLMATRLTGRRRVLLARSVHPEARAVVRTYCAGLSLVIEELPFDRESGALDHVALAARLGDDVACVVVQQPNFFGVIESLEPVAAAAHGSGALAVAMADPLALALLQPPREHGFDLVAGDGQPLGHPPRLGGAHFGFLAARSHALAALPGLYVRRGRTREGIEGYTLAQQAKSARSVLREKANSNVGTSSVIPALVGAAFVATMGPEGLRRAALLSQQRALAAAETLAALPGYGRRFSAPFFREFVLQTTAPAEKVAAATARHGIVGPYLLGRDYPELGDGLLFCFTEMNDAGDAARVAGALGSLDGGIE